MKRAAMGLLALMGGWTMAWGAESGSASAEIERGRLKADAEGCFECHHPDRPSPPSGMGPDTVWPRLTAQSADYLRKQLRDFASGARKNDFMAIMARNLDEADRRDITAYFASESPRGVVPAEGSARGRQLVEQGDATRGIPACASCHGARADGGAGAVAGAPRLLAQDPRYLASQLRAWRSGERANSVGGVMSAAARSLDDKDIAALAAHLGAP